MTTSTRGVPMIGATRRSLEQVSVTYPLVALFISMRVLNFSEIMKVGSYTFSLADQDTLQSPTDVNGFFACVLRLLRC